VRKKLRGVGVRPDVAVIGGGPAGAIAAKTLAEGGLEVILIERDLKTSKPCGGGIPFTAFREFNIPEVLIKKNVEIVEIISPRGEKLSIKLKDGMISIVNRGEFDASLRGLACEKGATLIEAEFISFAGIEKSNVKLLLRGKEGQKMELSSRYVIIADGVNSRARHSLGLPPSDKVFTLSARFEDIKNERVEFWFGSDHAPGFYSWVFPLSAGTGSSVASGIKERFNYFCKKRGIEPKNIRGYPIPLWSRRGQFLQYSSNILLAGDAAGLVMPLTFEGIYYAMASGKLAAQAIIEKRPVDYKRLWRDRYLKRFMLMKLLWRYFLRSDTSAERLVEIHRDSEVQEIAMKLWLRKSVDKESLNSYAGVFKKYIGAKLGII
jgi:geranylgeranyl reductase